MLSRNALAQQRKILGSELQDVVVPIIESWVKARAQTDPLLGGLLFECKVTSFAVEDGRMAASEIVITSFNNLLLKISLAETAAEFSIGRYEGAIPKDEPLKIISIEVPTGPGRGRAQSATLTQRKSLIPIELADILEQFQDAALGLG